MGMQPCERSDKIPEGKSSHTLYLAGVYRGGHDALVRAKLALSDNGVTMQLTVRSSDPDASEVLATAIGWFVIILFILIILDIQMCFHAIMC